MLYVLQTGLVDYHSHYYQETLGQIDACRAQGIRMKLYTNRRTLKPIITETVAMPSFRDEPDALFDVDKNIRPLANFITTGERFAEDCARLVKDGVTAADIVFVPHARIRHLHGLARWLEKLPAARRPIVACRFDDPDEAWLTPGSETIFNEDQSFTRFAMAELLGLLPAQRILLFGTTPLLCQIVTNFTGHPCVRVPIGIFYPSIDEIEVMRAAATHPRVGMCIAGQFRHEKGGGLIPDILSAYSRRNPGAAVSLQLNDEADLESLRANLAARGVEVPIIPQIGECSIPDHYARLLASRVVLLPYMQHRYVARGSGIFAEAVACGIPVVVPQRTWMSYQLETQRAAGTAFESFTLAAIDKALTVAIDYLPALTAQARARQQAWHAEENVAEATRVIMATAAPAMVH